MDQRYKGILGYRKSSRRDFECDYPSHKSLKNKAKHLYVLDKVVPNCCKTSTHNCCKSEDWIGL